MVTGSRVYIPNFGIVDAFFKLPIIAALTDINRVYDVSLISKDQLSQNPLYSATASVDHALLQYGNFSNDSQLNNYVPNKNFPFRLLTVKSLPLSSTVSPDNSFKTLMLDEYEDSLEDVDVRSVISFEVEEENKSPLKKRKIVSM